MKFVGESSTLASELSGSALLVNDVPVESTDSVLAIFRLVKVACLDEIVQDCPARIRRDAEEFCCLVEM
jgi:hypothetical protein